MRGKCQFWVWRWVLTSAGLKTPVFLWLLGLEFFFVIQSRCQLFTHEWTCIQQHIRGAKVDSYDFVKFLIASIFGPAVSTNVWLFWWNVRRNVWVIHDPINGWETHRNKGVLHSHHLVVRVTLTSSWEFFTSLRVEWPAAAPSSLQWVNETNDNLIYKYEQNGKLFLTTNVLSKPLFCILQTMKQILPTSSSSR